MGVAQYHKSKNKTALGALEITHTNCTDVLLDLPENYKHIWYFILESVCLFELQNWTAPFEFHTPPVEDLRNI